MQGTQIVNSPIESFSTTIKFSMPSPTEEITPLIVVKYEFEYRKKNKLELFPLESSKYQDSDATEKSQIFSVENSFTNAVVLIEIPMEELKLVVIEK